MHYSARPRWGSKPLSLNNLEEVFVIHHAVEWWQWGSAWFGGRRVALSPPVPPAPAVIFARVSCSAGVCRFFPDPLTLHRLCAILSRS